MAVVYMGRLTEYIYGNSKTKTNYINKVDKNGDVTITGADETVEFLNSIITTDARMEKAIRRLIKGALKQARSNVSKDVRSYMSHDPRGAYKAVKHAVYKKLFGGYVSILQKTKKGAPTNYVKPRMGNIHRRGGNKWGRSKETERMESYGGSDRGFVLRFLNSGAMGREIHSYTDKQGNYQRIKKTSRGSIADTGLFSHTAPWQVDAAASLVSEAIEELIEMKSNG